MANFAPLFLAFLLNCSGVYIFTRPKNYDCLPYLSYVIFLTSVYFFLRRVYIIPVHYRRLFGWAELIIEFSIIMLLMEFIVNNIWYPLQLSVMAFLKGLPHTITGLIRAFGFNYNVCDKLKFIRSPAVLWVASYVLSLFFFVAVGHATKFFNVAILTECGLYYFVLETADRANQCAKALLMSFLTTKKNKRPTYPSRCDFDSSDFSSEVCADY